MALKLVIKAKDGRPGPPLARLPGWVAEDDGLLTEEGVELSFADQDREWGVRPAGEEDIEAVSSFNPHFAFEEGAGEVFAACEWGQVRRAYDSQRGGRIVARTDGAQWHGIVAAPDTPFTHPRTLFNQPVAVRFHAGSHYATLELLEGFIKRDEIKLVNLTHHDGYEADVYLVRDEDVVVIAVAHDRRLPAHWASRAETEEGP